MKSRFSRFVITFFCKALQLSLKALFRRNRVFQIAFDYVGTGLSHSPLLFLCETRARPAGFERRRLVQKRTRRSRPCYFVAGPLPGPCDQGCGWYIQERVW